MNSKKRIIHLKPKRRFYRGFEPGHLSEKILYILNNLSHILFRREIVNISSKSKNSGEGWQYFQKRAKTQEIHSQANKNIGILIKKTP